jgi:hypothetical protein
MIQDEGTNQNGAAIGFISLECYGTDRKKTTQFPIGAPSTHSLLLSHD